VNFDLYFHLTVETDRDPVDTEQLQGLLQHHRAAVNLEVELSLIQLVGYVRIRDRPKQFPVIPRSYMENRRDTIQLRSPPTSLEIVSLGQLFGRVSLVF
jgi:membrane-associated protease RseP (regulator of RpoE activity)